MKNKRTGIAEIIDEICGEGAREQIQILALMSKGVMVDPHIPGAFQRVPAATAQVCAQWIADQRHGKAHQSVEVDVSGQIDHSAGPQLEAYKPGELEALERLLEKGYQVVEGEFTERPALTNSQVDANQPETPVLAVSEPIKP